ncbi:MAG: hypothetical protein AAGF88_05620 [Pseudomonadota bacterium]
MIARFALAVLGSILSLGAVPAAAQDAPVPISGEWQVGYADHELGLVSGRAVIDASETSATVTLAHPDTGASYVLTSSSFVRSGNTLQMVLEGQSPHSLQETGLDEPFSEIAVPEPLRDVTFSYGSSELVTQIAPRFESDLNRIDLTLVITGDTMSGHWRYSADPVTLRDQQGYGRVGFHAAADDGGVIQSGVETWTRPIPVIYGVIPIESQLAIAVDEPAHPYPFTADAPNASDRRFLFVFGEDLPQGPGDRLELRDDHSQISYQRAYFAASDGVGGFGSDLIARGRQKLLESLPPSEHAAALELDFIVLEATLRPGVLPGHHRFFLNDVAGGWLLQFGDNFAELAFVRQVTEPSTPGNFTPAPFGPSHRYLSPDGYETTDALYLRETIALELRTNAVLPIDEIPLLVSHNGEFAVIGGGLSIQAHRTDDPRVYRTEAIQLVHPTDASVPLGSAFVFPTTPGSQFSARVGIPDLISIPAATPVARVQRREIADDTLWHEALSQAAQCAGVESRDWASLAIETAATISNRIIISTSPFERLDLRVTLADHAAMILLRARFLEMMRHQDREINSFQSDDELRVFRALIEPAVRSHQLPISRFEVTFPDGERDWFQRTYDAYAVAQYYRQTSHEAEAWVLDATREVIAEFRRAIAFSISYAEATDPCDVEDMLDLTGLGYEAVVTSLLPRLMTPFSPGGNGVIAYEWRPDRLARAAVFGVGVLAEAARAQAAYSELDTNLVRTAAIVATLPLTMGGSWVGSGINFVLDSVDLAYVTFQEIPTTWRSHREYAFARGASAVLGTYRFELAEQGRRSVVMTAVSFIGSSVSIVSSLRELPSAYHRFQSSLAAARIAAGREILWSGDAPITAGIALPATQVVPPSAASGVPEATLPTSDVLPTPLSSSVDDLTLESQFDNLPGLHSSDDLLGSGEPEAWLDDVFDEIAQDRAEDVATALRNVEDIQGLAPSSSGLELSFSGQLDLSAARPGWATDLSEETWSALGRHLHRPDIQAFIASDPDGFAALLSRDPVSAFAVLHSDPRPTFQDFETAVAAFSRRQSGSQGAAFFDATHGNNQTQADRLLANHGISIEGDIEYLDEVAAGLHQDGGSFTLRFVEIQGATDTNAKFTRTYDRTTGSLTLANAEINTMRRWMPEMDIPFVDGRGTPTTLYANLRSMNAFGIGYAGSGAPLNQVIMSTVVNPRTTTQLAWLRQTYPDLPDSELIRHTFSYQYAETAIRNAGYRITDARIDGGDFTSLGIFEAYYAGREDWASFIQRHGLTSQSRVQAGFEIYLNVAPAP